MPIKRSGVLNSCRIANGEIISSEGVAYSQNQGNSKLKVSFLPTGLRWIPFTKGHYWVLRVDPEYKVALWVAPVINTYGFCHANRNWMKPPIKSYLETAKHYGYDVTKLIKLPH